MTRFAIWTGWSFAPKRRADQPSMVRLMNASTLSIRSDPQLQDLRSDQDDDRCDVHPGQEPGGEGDGSEGAEFPDRPRVVPERHLSDLPQHGRYQSGRPS